MPDSPPLRPPPSSADHPRQALQPRDLAEEWDETLWRARLESARAAAARARPRYEGAEPLRDRLREPGLWMLVGLPASGKSTFASALAARGRAVVGIDAVRAEDAADRDGLLAAWAATPAPPPSRPPSPPRRRR